MSGHYRMKPDGTAEVAFTDIAVGIASGELERLWEPGSRRVALTEANGVRVSTMFLVIDHSFGLGEPLLWETMIFGGPYNCDEQRYTSLREALTGHDEMCRKAFGDTVPATEFGPCVRRMREAQS